MYMIQGRKQMNMYIPTYIYPCAYMYYLATKTRNHIDCIPNQNAVLDIIIIVEKLNLISDLSFIEGTCVPLSETIWIFMLKSCSVQAQLCRLKIVISLVIQMYDYQNCFLWNLMNIHCCILLVYICLNICMQTCMHAGMYSWRRGWEFGCNRLNIVKISMDVIFLAPSSIVTLLVSFGVMLVKFVSCCWILIRLLSLWLGFEAQLLLNQIYFHSHSGSTCVFKPMGSYIA